MPTSAHLDLHFGAEPKNLKPCGVCRCPKGRHAKVRLPDHSYRYSRCLDTRCDCPGYEASPSTAELAAAGAAMYGPEPSF